MSTGAENDLLQAAGLPAEPAGETRLVATQVELAEALKCDRKTVSRYLKMDENPGRTPDGFYNVTVWSMWVEQKGRLKDRRKSQTKEDLELEHQRLQNERIRIANARSAGDLVSVDECWAVLEPMFTAFARKLRGLDDELAPQVVGVPVPEAKARLQRGFRHALDELALGDWAKKKAFWSSVHARLSDLRERLLRGSGLKSM